MDRQENHHMNCPGASVLLGLSGGVDSAAAASLLLQDGYSVTALTLRTVGDGDYVRAAEVARSLSIEHIEIDAVEDFYRVVISPFVESWRAGDTPNPCVLCNQHFKFHKLMEVANRLGCDYIATGHYARLIGEPSHRYLLRAKERRRDQSYFLYRLSRSILDRTLLPLGEYTKDQVRRIASSFDVVTGQTSDSQDICFLGATKLRKFLSEQGLEDVPGVFVDTSGVVLGEHLGSWRYSEGQRRGLGVSLGKRMTVLGKDSERNLVMLGDEKDAMITRIELRDVLLIDPLPSTFDASVQLRSQGRTFPAHIALVGRDAATVHFVAPVRLTSIGQSAVFYHEDRVLGGGIVRLMA
jgi:tRNA-specific 2-thiouridylase